MEIKFTSSSVTLLNHLQAISKVIKSKNTLPILDCFLFEIEGSTLKILASDLETTMDTSLELESVSGAGKFAMSAKIILDTLKEFPEQPLTFSIDTDSLKVQIKSSNGSFSIVGQRADNYPQSPEIKGESLILNVPVGVILNGLNKTFFATADDELRPVMNGIYFDMTPDGLTFVASDSHKLVQLQSKQIRATEATSFILSKKPASLLMSILSKENLENEVLVKYDDKNAYFQLSKYKMVCRLVEGKFPNYKAVIPQDNVNKFTIDRVSFITTLKRVNVFSNQASNLVKLALSNNEITISAQDIDFSTSAKETLPCQYDGPVMNIGFKSLFILQILQNIETSEVVIALGDHSRAGLFFPIEQKEDENLLMLLTPLSLNE